MTLQARLLTFLMCHVGFFAAVFLIFSVQQQPAGTDPAAAALEQSQRAGTIVMAGELN